MLFFSIALVPKIESSMPAIYLSGPITGTTAQADNWRAQVRRKLPSSYKFFDPTKQDPDRTVGYLRSLSPTEDLERHADDARLRPRD